MNEAVRRKPSELPPDLAPEQRQREASDPSASVWVGASAGSGKTTVLTSRVMRLLLDGVAPQKILCLTFTRAAAAEMAIRVTDQLSLWATCGDEDLRKSLDELQGKPPKPRQLTEARRLFARVLSCPGGMRIRTIHAFCQEILGRFPIEAGLPPHFAVIEEADAHGLIEEAQADLLRELPAAPDSPLARAVKFLVCELSDRGFATAMRDVLSERARLSEAIDAAGGFDKLVAGIRAFLALEPGETAQGIIRSAVDFAILPQADIRQAATWLREGTPKYSERGEDILRWLNLPDAARAAAFTAYTRFFLKLDGMPYVQIANKNILQAHPDLEKIINREAARLQSTLERVKTVGIAETTEAVLRLGGELMARYENRKTQQAALDYDDLVIRANELLHRPGIAPWVLYKLDGGLDHILVDEAQDTSRAQWSIVKALADEFFAGVTARDNTKRTLFAVGDEKQSIFSFQNADPEAFAEMRDYFARRLDDTGRELRPVGLHISFRSAPAILKAVDGVFAHARACEGVSSEIIRHFPARPRKGEPEKIGRVEVWPLLPASEKDRAETGDNVWSLPLGYEDEHDPQAALAGMIASKIAVWCATKEILPGANRAIEPGAIMILLRNRGRFADLMVRALKQRGVPVTGVDRMNLTQQLPVMDLLALVQFALLPEDDLNLATVLRGPLVNCSEEQLMDLAIGREGSLWHSLGRKAAEFSVMHAYLTRILNEADFMTPFVMLARILNEPCPGSAISGRRALWARLGPDALDPIEELLNVAQDFSVRHAPSLQSFMHWIMATETVIKRELDRGGGQVRIMTVHGSKGLEAPIVILPDTTGVPRVQNVPKFLWSEHGTPLYVPRKPESGAAVQLWSEARRKQMEEYRRLLYVALTRAANRLYIGGWEPAKPEANADECWYNLVVEGLKDAGVGVQGSGGTAALAGNDPLQPIIAFADPELRTVEEKNPVQDIPAAKIELPAWVLRPAPEEPEIFKSLAPSQIAAPPAATPDGAFARGTIIHRLLQSLPDVDEDKRDSIAARFLANPQHHLTPEQQKEIQTEVMNLLGDPAYAPLFGPDSRAEVPLTGWADGHIIAGQIDRLCLRGDEVWIVDYKTNRPPPETPAEVSPAYGQQLAIYRAVLRDIYPGKTVRCFLLWTYGPRFMELPEGVLSR